VGTTSRLLSFSGAITRCSPWDLLKFLSIKMDFEPPG
jgi:hypothetical protein